MSRARFFIAALTALVFTAVWLAPNVGGRLFVSVGEPRLVDGGTALAVDVVNRYPMAVVVSFEGPAFRVALYRSDGSTGAPAWESTLEDPELEEALDSPGGLGSTRPAVIPPGSVTKIVPVSGQPSAAGTYLARVWAYGIPSSLVPITLRAG